MIAVAVFGINPKIFSIKMPKNWQNSEKEYDLFSGARKTQTAYRQLLVTMN
jgi:hypothetical protein